jgi:TonB dependent receptor
VEAYHEDGPWQNPVDYQKFNGILTYSQGDSARGFSVTARGYHGKWNSSDQISASNGRTNFFGTFNPTTGSKSQRYSLQAQWQRADENSATKVMAYGFYYDLDLFSDFTYFLTDTNKGDQFEQTDTRWVAGLIASHTLFSQWWGHEVQNTFGLQVRNDWINNGLYQTQNRHRTEKIDSATSAILPAMTRQDSVVQTEIGTYYNNQAQRAEKFRSVFGERGDIYNFSVRDQIPANSGDRVSGLASPKLSLIFGPWAKTEVYLQGGLGFHSNDVRSTTATTNTDGRVIGKKAAGLARTEGAEIGARTFVIPKLQSNLSFWYLHSDSELLFQGDTGDTCAAPQPSNRCGVELANFYTPTDWLAFDFDYADFIARFESPDSDGGTHEPKAVGQVISGGATIHDLQGFTGSLRLRYFGPRDLISTGQYQSSETLLFNALVSYRFNKTWTLSAEVLNLLNRQDHDIDTPTSPELTRPEPRRSKFIFTRWNPSYCVLV